MTSNGLFYSLFQCLICLLSLVFVDVNTELSIENNFMEVFTFPNGSHCCEIQQESANDIKELTIELYNMKMVNESGNTFNLKVKFIASNKTYIYGVFEDKGKFNKGDKAIKKNHIKKKDKNQKNYFIIRGLKKSATYYIVVFVVYKNDDNKREKRISARRIVRYIESSKSIQIVNSSLGPKIIKVTLVSLKNGELVLLVSCRHDMDPSENIAGYLAEVSPTRLDMNSHKQKQFKEAGMRGMDFTFSNVTQGLEYEISIATILKGEKRQISSKDYVINRVILTFPNISHIIRS
ncbi:unnamed protein product [Gordionus sp. m RMFG-2023]